MRSFPFLQSDGDSIREEIMENSDIGEHEDTDVKNERQKVFNFVVSSALGQEPPLVLLQVSQVRIEDIRLSDNTNVNNNFRRIFAC